MLRPCSKYWANDLAFGILRNVEGNILPKVVWSFWSHRSQKTMLCLKGWARNLNIIRNIIYAATKKANHHLEWDLKFPSQLSSLYHLLLRFIGWGLSANDRQPKPPQLKDHLQGVDKMKRKWSRRNDANTVDGSEILLNTCFGGYIQNPGK